MSITGRKVIPLNAEVRSILEQRKLVKHLRSELDVANAHLKAREQELAGILELQPGEIGLIIGDFEVSLIQRERRTPSWKDHFVAVTSPEAAERVLAETVPTITEVLVIESRRDR